MAWNQTLVHNALIGVRVKIRELSELPENKYKIKDLFRLYYDFKMCEEFIMASESNYHIKYTFMSLINEFEISYNLKFHFDQHLLDLLKKLNEQKDL